MLINDSKKAKIKNFVIAELSLLEIGVFLDEYTIFFDDIPIAGIDLDIFFQNFFDRYNIDYKTFNPNKYYMSEYDLGNIFLTIFRAVFNRKKLIKLTFTIDHLYAVIEKGEWFDP